MSAPSELTEQIPPAEDQSTTVAIDVADMQPLRA